MKTGHGYIVAFTKGERSVDRALDEGLTHYSEKQGLFLPKEGMTFTPQKKT